MLKLFLGNWQFVLKNLKNNIRNNKFLMAGLIFNLTLVYCFLFMEAAVENADLFWIAWNYGETVGTISTCTTISMISGFFLTMSVVVPYMKGRIREYSLLMTLGIEKKAMYLLVGIEYMLICLYGELHY